jgi:hypothetical protein
MMGEREQVKSLLGENKRLKAEAQAIGRVTDDYTRWLDEAWALIDRLTPYIAGPIELSPAMRLALLAEIEAKRNPHG